MTPGGAATGKMQRSFAGEITDSEKTAASIEAMAKLEEEEAEGIDLGDTVIDESTLDPSEQMGRKAIITTGDGETKAVSARNSILPEADQIRERGVEFIDRDDPVVKKEAFIEDEGGDDDESDFLEI